MDFLKDIQWGNVFTAITLLTTLALGLRDYNRTKAEAAAKNAEANKTDIDAADVITDSALKLLTPKDKQIEQQDSQITRLLNENQQLSSKFNALEAEVRLKSEEHSKDMLELTNHVKSLENSNLELTRQNETWKLERKDWETGIGTLLSQLVKAKIVPLWLPNGVTISEIELEPKLVISGFGSKRVEK